MQAWNCCAVCNTRAVAPKGLTGLTFHYLTCILHAAHKQSPCISHHPHFFRTPHPTHPTLPRATAPRLMSPAPWQGHWALPSLQHHLDPITLLSARYHWHEDTLPHHSICCMRILLTTYQHNTNKSFTSRNWKLPASWTSAATVLNQQPTEPEKYIGPSSFQQSKATQKHQPTFLFITVYTLPTKHEVIQMEMRVSMLKEMIVMFVFQPIGTTWKFTSFSWQKAFKNKSIKLCFKYSSHWSTAFLNSSMLIQS